jgi:ABC-type multidrug transport system fused ATPase/permease subunit
MDKYKQSLSISPIRYGLKHLKVYRTKLIQAILWSVLFVLLPMQVPVITGTLIDGLNMQEDEIGEVIKGLTDNNSTSAVANNNSTNDKTNSYNVNPFMLYGLINIGKTPTEVLTFSIISLIVIAIAYGLTAYLRTSSRSIISRNFVFELQKSIVQKLEFLSLDIHTKYGSGDLLNRTIVDTNSVRPFVEGSIIRVTANIARMAYPLLMLFVIDPRLALIASSILPLQLIIVRKLQSKIRTVSRQVRNDRAKLTTLLKENLDGIETIQTSNAEAYTIEKISKNVQKVEDAIVKSQRYYGMMTGFAWGLTAIGVSLTWWLGALKVLADEMSVGQLLIFTSFLLFAYTSLRRFTQAMKDHHRGLVAIRHLQEILETPSSVNEIENAPDLNIPHGQIQFQNVSFSLKENEPLLSDINIDIQPNTITAIVGKSGSGKSSILKLITRLFDPSEGQILIDGQNIKNASIRSLRSQIAVVTQVPVAFSGTIMENIRLAKPDASDIEVKDACLTADALKFISKFDKGLDTVLGQGGVHLSSDQLRKIALARALLKKPRILLLDETISTLDSESAKSIMNTLYKSKNDMTILITTHSREVIGNVDNTITLDNGKVLEVVEKVIRKKPVFKQSLYSRNPLSYIYHLNGDSITINDESSENVKPEKKITIAHNEQIFNFAEYKTIGWTDNQRPLNVIYVGDRANPQLKIFIMASQHGDEKYGRKASERLVNHLTKVIDKEFPNMCIVILPTANPDASIENSRKNRAGIDMNRDHVSLRTKENRIIHSFIRSWKPNLIIDVHNYPGERKYLQKRHYVFSKDILVDTPSNLAIRTALEQDKIKDLIKYMQSDLRAFNYSCDRYIIISSKGYVRHSTHDIIDARNFLSLRYDTLAILLEGREPISKDKNNKNERERAISAQYRALLSVLKWAKEHSIYLIEKTNSVKSKGGKIPIRSKYIDSNQHFRMHFQSTLTAKAEEVTLPKYFDTIKATKYANLPSAYAIPIGKSEIIELLHNHGFTSERIADSKWKYVEIYTIESFIPSKLKGKAPSKVKISVRQKLENLQNYIVFPIDQEGGRCLTLFLEAQSEYALHRYRNLNLHLIIGSDYPILRVV